MKVFKIFTLLLFLTSIIYSQTSLPKREFRAAWIASVINLDWPSNPNLSVAQQKSSLIAMLDRLHELNFNAVIFQIRPECDALYDSPYEPWSYWLTGSQGTPPSPYYDPLEFAIEEAHKRGMELHAWFNPYRAVRSEGTFSLSPEHVAVEHPEWILDVGSLNILNPGLPEVQQYNTDVIMDVVNRYDIDGVHFDDYFYPYPPDNFSDVDIDWQTFQTYPNGFTNIRDWRRNNVNVQMAMINDSIKVVKPWVKFGISPFGIWKRGVPPGIIGMNAYDEIFADPMAWLHDESVDYLTPQLYWKIGGDQDYSKLMPWWADSVDHYNRHLYTGNIFNSGYSNTELPRQLTLNRNNPKTLGIVLFKASNVVANSLTFADSLANNYFRYKSLSPVMSWKDVIPPNQPMNVQYGRLPGRSIAGLYWDLPSTAADGDSASRYSIYRFDNSSIQPSDFDDPANLFSVAGGRISELKPEVSPTGKYYFAVRSLDRNFNESTESNLVEILPPETPMLAYPANGTGNQRDTTLLGWNYPPESASYNLQVASDMNFDNIVFEETGLTDTVESVTGIGGQQTFYWKVQANNAAGVSNFSDTRSFDTAFPIEPFIVYPPDVTPGIPTEIELVWDSTPLTDSYHVQLAKGANFTQSSMVIDSVGITDTAVTAPTLDPNRFYFLRVRSKNSFGYGLWSEVHNFKTGDATLIAEETGSPTDFVLNQNYPNPFNPTTTITFSLAEQGLTSLKVYDILGREVAELVSEELTPGKYSVSFNAGKYASGIYIYSLRSKNKIINKKMSLIK
jgi:uncharacterized lipoprotein YddW (UPF0748 family)